MGIIDFLERLERDYIGGLDPLHPVTFHATLATLAPEVRLFASKLLFDRTIGGRFAPKASWYSFFLAPPYRWTGLAKLKLLETLVELVKQSLNQASVIEFYSGPIAERRK